MHAAAARLAPPAGVADLSNPDAFVNGPPHETFRRLREEAPVCFCPERDGTGFWSVTRWEDIRAVSLDQSIFSSFRGGVMLRDFPGDLLEAQRETLPSMEPGRHGKHRRLVSSAFTARVVRDLEPRIRTLVSDLLDKMAPLGTCDFVTEVAAELPVQVICELLGIPLEDRARIIQWSNAMVGMDDPEYSSDITEPQQAAFQLYAYAFELAALRRAEPRDDLMSHLLQVEVDGERLNDGQIGAFMMVLSVAGNETTRNLISGGLHTLFEHPAERARLQNDLSLVPSAVEEMLRWVTPVMHFRRTAERDVELRGQHIREGDKVVMWYVAGNRDDAVFAAPDRFDVGRTPNDHLAFGFGPHYCLGASLAQLEARLLFTELLQRFPDIQSAGPIERMRANHIAGTKHLPVRFTAR